MPRGNPQVQDQTGGATPALLEELSGQTEVARSLYEQVRADHPPPVHDDDEEEPWDEPEDPDLFASGPLPDLLQSWGADTVAEYCQLLQATLLRLARNGLNPALAPIQIDAYLRHCSAEGLDPAASRSRSHYAAELARRDETVVWPPARNALCWCGSGRKYNAAARWSFRRRRRGTTPRRPEARFRRAGRNGRWCLQKSDNAGESSRCSGT